MAYLTSIDNIWSPIQVEENSSRGKLYKIVLWDNGEYCMEYKGSYKENIPEKIYNAASGINVGWSGNVTGGLEADHIWPLLNDQINKPYPVDKLFRFSATGELNEGKDCNPVKLGTIRSEKKNKHYIFTTKDIVGFYGGNWDKGDFKVFANDSHSLCFDIRARFGDQMLMHMLSRAYSKANLQEFLINTQESSHGTLLLLAIIWLTALKKALPNGLPRLYVERVEDRAALRGKLEIQRLLNNKLSGRNPHLIPCRFRDLTHDNIINQTIRRCYRIIRNILKSYSPAMLSDPQRADTLLASYGVKNRNVYPSELDSIHYTSLAEAYRPLMTASRALLTSIPKTPGGGSREGHTFLFSVTELWEFYIKDVLEESLSMEGYSFHSANEKDSQERKYILQKPLHESGTQSDQKPAYQLIPDIIIKNGDGYKAIFDAKYKRVSNNKDYKDADNYHSPYRILRADINQLLTYLTIYNSNLGSLVYPYEIPFAFALNEDKGEDLCEWPGNLIWDCYVGDIGKKIWTCPFILPLCFDEVAGVDGKSVNITNPKDSDELPHSILIQTSEGIRLVKGNGVFDKYISVEGYSFKLLRSKEEKPDVNFEFLIQKAEEDYTRRVKHFLRR